MDEELQGLAPEAPAVTHEQQAAESKPQNMHDAMFARDEKGRFAPKPEADPAAEPEQEKEGKPAADPAAQVAQSAASAAKPEAPVAPDDITKMPEGLGPKAQERFQKLVTEVKARDEQIEELRGAVSYVQESFQQHGVQREQFEQAVGFIGAINRGDYASAEQLLLGQLRQLSLLTGKDYGGEVDPLAEFPDIAQKVQGLQIAREDAIEIARMRRIQAQQQQAMQTQQATAQQTQRAEQEFRQAQTALDGWARQMAAQDIDWPAIEAKLLPVLPELLKGVPPGAWPNVVQTQYRLLKTAAQEFRPQPVSAPSPLRPTGAASPQQRPGSMYEAMFGGS